MVEWADLEDGKSLLRERHDMDPSREAEAWVTHAAMRVAKVVGFGEMFGQACTSMLHRDDASA